MTEDPIPNPGSPEAVAQGCACPVFDNRHGQGFRFRGEVSFWLTEGCPVHEPEAIEGQPS